MVHQKAAELVITTGPCAPDVCVCVCSFKSLFLFKTFFQFLSNQTLPADSSAGEEVWNLKALLLDSNRCCFGSPQADSKCQDAAVVAAARLPAPCGGLQQNRGPGHHIEGETQPW